MKSFAQLFKRYRLRAEFATFASFGDALSEKGYFYEESIFSHWQKGTRIPNNRELVITIIKIFVERKALNTITEANELLASVGLGYVTDKERKSLGFHQQSESPFQVPNEISYFTGRKELIAKIQKEIKNGKIILLYGSPGVGKTALAIKLGHILHDTFSDGVLWYKVDSSNVMDILLSIAHLFGEDIREIKDIEVRASIVRTLLAKKKVLLILDNATKQDKLHLFLPNNASSGVIFSSQESTLHFTNHYTSFFVDIFTREEILELFQKVFTTKYVAKNKKRILDIAESVGNLPLAVNIAATHIKRFTITPDEYFQRLKNQNFDLHALKYEDKNLLQTVTIGFSSLALQTQQVFSSLGIFEGKDFSLDAVAYINKLSKYKAEELMQQLSEISFIEKSKVDRYRIHPLLKLFAREKLKSSSVYLRAAKYYEQLLISAQETHSYRTITQDTDNIIYIFKKCYDLGYWDQIITFWNPIEKFLSDTNEVKKLRSTVETVDIAPQINILQKLFTGYYVLLLIYWFILFFSGLKESFWNDFYSLSYTILPLGAGGISLARSKPWGLFSNNIGKAIFFTALGLFLWGIGNSIWAYYNFFQDNAVPYPSWADAGFAPGYGCWIISAVYLSFATGAKFGLKEKRKKLFMLIVPCFIITCSYYFLLFVIKRTFSAETPIHIFFDLYYPSMDIINLTISTIILGVSVNFLRRKYRLSLFSILMGFACLYIADFLFSYLTSINKYYNGGIDDLFFSSALYLLSWGTLSFYLTPKRIK